MPAKREGGAPGLGLAHMDIFPQQLYSMTTYIENMTGAHNRSAVFQKYKAP